MSLIDDVVGKKLPTGRKFQAKVGAGNVEKKLYAATRSGALQNLADDQEIINKIAQKRQSHIRAGKYTRDMRKADFVEALKSGNLSKDDQRDLKAILEHWGRGEQVKKVDVKPKEPSKAQKRAAEAKKRINPAPRRELPEFLKNRGSVSIKKNPWLGANSGGLGGGIFSGNRKSSGPRRPTLLK